MVLPARMSSFAETVDLLIRGPILGLRFWNLVLSLVAVCVVSPLVPRTPTLLSVLQGFLNGSGTFVEMFAVFFWPHHSVVQLANGIVIAPAGWWSRGVQFAQLFFVWNLWCVVGGLIAANSASIIWRDESLGGSGLVERAKDRGHHLLGPFVLPISALLIFAAIFLVMILPLRWERAAFWLMPFVSLMSFLAMSLLALAYVTAGLAWPLMSAAIAIERCDGFDALSRTFNYVLSHPLRSTLCVCGAGLANGVGMGVAFVITEFAIGVGHSFAMTILLAPQAESLTAWSRFWQILVLQTVMTSWFWCQATAIYLILRRDEDRMPIHEATDGPPLGAGEQFPVVGIPAMRGSNTNDALSKPASADVATANGETT